MYIFFLHRPRQRRPVSSLHLQKFSYNDGYITCVNDSSLCLGITDTEGRIIEVVLTRQKPDDIMQRWIVNDNGYVTSHSSFKQRLYRIILIVENSRNF